ncbi:MAG: hypothetical protein ACXWMW_05375 [Syntrophales bacterium]
MAGKGVQESWNFDIKGLIYFEHDELNLADSCKERQQNGTTLADEAFREEIGNVCVLKEAKV